jgi:hypothetical protein
VTGVVITPEEGLSVGRSRKRFVKSLVHKYVRGELQPEERAYLRGMIAFISNIEPNFMDRLKAKYGNEGIESLLRGE